MVRQTEFFGQSQDEIFDFRIYFCLSSIILIIFLYYLLKTRLIIFLFGTKYFRMDHTMTVKAQTINIIYTQSFVLFNCLMCLDYACYDVSHKRCSDYYFSGSAANQHEKRYDIIILRNTNYVMLLGLGHNIQSRALLTSRGKR